MTVASGPRKLHEAPAMGFKLSQRIAMTDGTELNAVLYHPEGGPWPLLIEFTPYHATFSTFDGPFFASAGFAVLWVDARGRGDSGGDRRLFRDTSDYKAVIEWAVRQKWCDGNILTYGLSYSGLNQWVLLNDLPGNVRALSPGTAPRWGLDIPAIGGVPLANFLFWHLGFNSGRLNMTSFASDESLKHRIASLWRANRPLSDIAAQTNVRLDDYFAGIYAEPPGSDLLDQSPSTEALARVDRPILAVSGLFDGCLQGTLAHFRDLEQHADASALEKCHLVIGPWGHVTADGVDRMGDLQFAPVAKQDMRQLKADFFTWALGRGKKPALLKDRFIFYVTGAEEWRAAPSVDRASAATASLFLASDGNPSDIYHSGRLQFDAAFGPSDNFRIDPFDDSPIAIEMESRPLPPTIVEGVAEVSQSASRTHNLLDVVWGEDPTNDVFARRLDGQGLVYHSAPLAEPLDIVGEPELALWLTADAPDFDLVVLLTEVLPDTGQSVAISGGLLRMRYRGGLDDPKPVPVSEAFEAHIPMRFAARQVRAGARLRLVVRSAYSLYFEKNLNSGLPRTEETPADARVANVSLLHEPGRQCALQLPIGCPEQRIIAD